MELQSGRNGGLLRWIVTVICEMFKISYQWLKGSIWKGDLLVADVDVEDFSRQRLKRIFPFGRWSEYYPIVIHLFLHQRTLITTPSATSIVQDHPAPR